jgi:predicted membrane channel-forming protein YqfA (hemolysin III family)
MYSGILLTHSYLRYIILALLVIVIIVSLLGVINKSPFSKKHDKLSLFLFICAHTQLLLGLLLYAIGARVQFNSETMKDPALRYFAVEHGLGMILAIVLITLARTSAKKTAIDQVKHKRMLIFNSVALLVIIVIVFYLGAPYNIY